MTAHIYMAHFYIRIRIALNLIAFLWQNLCVTANFFPKVPALISDSESNSDVEGKVNFMLLSPETLFYIYTLKLYF